MAAGGPSEPTDLKRSTPLQVPWLVFTMVLAPLEVSSRTHMNIIYIYVFINHNSIYIYIITLYIIYYML